MSYSSYSSPFDSASNYVRRSQIPGTIALIVISSILFLTAFFDHNIGFLFTFNAPPFAVIDLFTMFSYALLTQDFVKCVFLLFFLSMIGGSLERSWGTAKFLIFFFCLSAISAVGLVLGATVLRTQALLSGMYIPLTSAFVAWATINPLQTVLFCYIVPIQARWLAMFYVGVIYFELYGGSPVLGLFALLGPLVSYLTISSGLMIGIGYIPRKGPDLRVVKGGSHTRGRPLDDAGITMSLNPLSRLRAWQQRRRLAKLLQNSGYPEQDDEQRRR
jgi:membrane associated rhomboid family serine protease